MHLRSGRKTSLLTPQQPVKKARAPTIKRSVTAINRPNSKKRKLKTVRFEDALFSPGTPESPDEHPPFNRLPTPMHYRFPHNESEDPSIDLEGALPADWDGSAILTPDDIEEKSLSSDSVISVESEDISHTEEYDILESHGQETQDKATSTSASLNTAYYDDYIMLKDSAWEWCSKYFPATSQPLDLLDLCTTSPQLMEYANYISACTDKKTWEDVFDEQRPFLVYCILGKMLDVHIFGHEMLGGTEEQVEELRRVDREVMREDPFSRQHERSHLISAFLSSSPSKPSPSFPPSFPHPLPSTILATLSHLTASLIQMLTPLLPSSPSSPTPLPESLTPILLSAANLSLSLRTHLPQTEPGIETLYTLHTHPAIGSVFDPEEMHDLQHPDLPNAEAAAAEEEFSLEEPTTGIVSMTGWPSLVVYARRRLTPQERKAHKKQNPQRYKYKYQYTHRVLAPSPTLLTPIPLSAIRSSSESAHLGPSLRREMRERVKAVEKEVARREEEVARRESERERGERMAVGAAGLAMGAWLAMGWVCGQEWAGRWAREFVVGG